MTDDRAARAQPHLPFVGVTLCGYCESPLTQQPGGDWACERCKPFLVAIRTEADWVAFHAEAARFILRSAIWRDTAG